MSENDKRINAQLDRAFLEGRPVSATDATGLVQGMPVDDEVIDMYDILPEPNNVDTTLVQDTGGDVQKKKKP